MAVKIRLQRVGANNQPKYRMVVAEGSVKRDGRFVEILGNYDPTNKVAGKQLTVNLERTAYWVGVGAQPSDTARTLINRAKRIAAGSDKPKAKATISKKAKAAAKAAAAAKAEEAAKAAEAAKAEAAKAAKAAAEAALAAEAPKA